MEQLMHELVGRSLARERERDLAANLRLRESESQRGGRRRRSGPPPRHRAGTAPVVAHA